MALRKTSEAYATCRPKDSSAFAGETNDCSVRAFSLALNIPYAEAHALCAKHGRQYGKGTLWWTSHKVAWDCDMVPVLTYDAYAPRGARYPTLAQFIKEYPKGHFYLIRRGHAFALIDGVVHDWTHGTGARSRILRAYKAPEATTC